MFGLLLGKWLLFKLLKRCHLLANLDRCDELLVLRPPVVAYWFRFLTGVSDCSHERCIARLLVLL